MDGFDGKVPLRIVASSTGRRSLRGDRRRRAKAFTDVVKEQNLKSRYPRIERKEAATPSARIQRDLRDLPEISSATSPR